MDFYVETQNEKNHEERRMIHFLFLVLQEFFPVHFSLFFFFFFFFPFDPSVLGL